jgi:uroporphyrinogen decarboxylase
MKHRDRVSAALNHEESDRCPMQISFTPEFAVRLEAELKTQARTDTAVTSHNPHGGGNTYWLERQIDEDMLLTSVGWANSYYQEAGEYTDEWGIGWKSQEYETLYGTGRYTEIARHPLSKDEATESYTPPDPDRPELYTEAGRVIDTYRDEYWIVGVTVTTIFETAWALRGLEAIMMDFVVDPDLVERILDIPDSYHRTAAKRLVQMGVDMIWTGDDMGGQSAMVISPQMWRRFFKPRMARFISECKAINPAVKIAYHSDGRIFEIIPDLIEIGLDVLNPIQPASMDPAEVKRLFGDRLCFWGSIDEQHTLPFGTPDEVREEVLQRIQTIGKNGGLIIGPTHHIQLDTPMENFWALVNTIRQTRYGEPS